MQTMQTWGLTGDLTVPRSGHTATALHDGKVLVAGGSDFTLEGGTIFDSAELYDPSTNTWTPTGSMFYARVGHTATLLPNGHVLVAGGAINTNTELYDPATGEWYATGRLNARRPGSHDATLLADGRVLVAGGYDQYVPFPNCFVASAEIYDPQTQVWTPTGDMNIGRYGLTVTALANGKALVVGGGGLDFQATAELFDPATNAWTFTGELFTWRFGHNATLLEDGRVLVAGGLFYATTPSPHDESLDTAELYDPGSGNWFSVGKLNVARRYHTASRLHDGRVMVAGGVEHDLYSGGYVALATAELYDPATFTWTRIADLNEPRSGHTEAVLLPRRVIVPPMQPGSTVIVAGGGGDTANTAERYDVPPPPPPVFE